MTVADEVQLGVLITAAGSWLAAASFSHRRSRWGLGSLVVGAAGGLAGAALMFSGLARSAFG